MKHGFVCATLIAAAALTGCDAASPTGRASGGAAANGGFPTAGTFGLGTAGTSALDGAGTGGFAGSSGIDAADGGGVPGRPTSGTTALPCTVNDVLETSCQSCHAATPLSGVPMALISWEDTQQPAVSSPGLSVHDLMKTRIHDALRPMPPTGMLPADKLALLDAWLDGGAIAGTDPSCAPQAGMGEGVLPPDVENCYEVRAHQAAGDDSPLQVSGEDYATFYFDAPWPDGAQGVYFETIGGMHPEIIHHWLIYAEENGSQPDGTVDYPTAGSHPSAPTLVAGWAPGANNNDLPLDVGMQLAGANRKMSMEIHFFNKSGMTLPADSGVKICTVEKNLRANTATVSWLGTELGINIPAMAQASTATGYCTPQVAGDIHVIRSWPHMHLLGRAMESTIVRANGTREPVSPAGGWPFDFNNEVSWKTEYVVHPGDKVETICHYTNTTNKSVGVGYNNSDEMCFNFTLAYPAKALVNKNFLGGSTSLTNSSTACLN